MGSEHLWQKIISIVFRKEKSQVFVIEFHINWYFIFEQPKHCQF